MRWSQRIARARSRRVLFGLIARPRFNADDRFSAREWALCAAGQAAADLGITLPIEKRDDGFYYSPNDELDGLGMSFDEAVMGNHIDAAEGLSECISARVRALYGHGVLNQIAECAGRPG
jgi:hypothetical protein